MSPITLQVAHTILEYIGDPIDSEFTVYPVPHTVDAMPALQKGNILKWAHNVIADRGEGPKANSP